MSQIWTYWEQGWQNAPTHVQECVASWEIQNPTFQVNRLSAANIDDFLKFTDAEKQLLSKLRVQTKSDVYRLMLLHKHGGVWVDATLYCNRPLDEWLKLSTKHPVALFENPGPDRLVSSWFIAAEPNAQLIELWLNEFWDYLKGLPNPETPKGFRKIIQKILQRRYGNNIHSTLFWWNTLPYQRLSLTPYFIVHYCYNRLCLNNSNFEKLAKTKIGFPAETAHIVQFLLAGKTTMTDSTEITDAFVHKLNWRKLPENETIADVLKRLKEETA